MIIVCKHCQASPRDGVELFKVQNDWICREHLRIDLLGIKKHFELEDKVRKAKIPKRKRGLPKIDIRDLDLNYV